MTSRLALCRLPRWLQRPAHLQLASRLALWTSHRNHHPTTSTPIAHARHISLASSPPVQTPKTPGIILRSPTRADLQAQELDVDVIPTSHIHLLLTDRAAEQLRHISSREGNPDVALRIAVESGGCHGYQYKLGLARGRAPEDYHLAHPDIRPSNVFVDAVSLPMLNGSTVDYATELIGSSFRVTGNPQAKGGCGCGISWELKD